MSTLTIPKKKIVLTDKGITLYTAIQLADREDVARLEQQANRKIILHKGLIKDSLIGAAYEAVRTKEEYDKQIAHNRARRF